MHVAEHTVEATQMVDIPADLIMNRVSYITRIIREIDSMDFSTSIIKAILNSAEKPVEELSKVEFEGKDNSHAPVLNILRDNYVKLIPNATESEVAAALHNVKKLVNQISFIANVQALSGPVGQIFNLTNRSNELSIVSTLVEAKTRIVNSKFGPDLYGQIHSDIFYKILNVCPKLITYANLNDITKRVVEAADTIHTTSKRGRGNAIVMHPNTYNTLVGLNGGGKQFTVQSICDPITFESIDYVAEEMLDIEAFIAGIPIRLSIEAPLDNIIIGYNGQNSTDGGITFAPYQMRLVNEFGKVSVRYAMHDDNIKDYFTVVQIVKQSI